MHIQTKTTTVCQSNKTSVQTFCTHQIFFFLIDKTYDAVHSPHMIKKHGKAKMDDTEALLYTLRGSSGPYL